MKKIGTVYFMFQKNESLTKEKKFRTVYFMFQRKERKFVYLFQLQICEELLSRCLAPDCQMGGLGCDNMTVVLACLLQNKSWDELKRKCMRPRPPTPTLAEEGNQSGFVTPPPTPHGPNRPKTPPTAEHRREEMADAELVYPSPSSTENNDKKKKKSLDQHQDIEIGLGESPPIADQTVPEVVRESSSDSEPSQSPAKQGKLINNDESFTDDKKVTAAAVARVAAAVAADEDKSSSLYTTNSSSASSTTSSATPVAAAVAPPTPTPMKIVSVESNKKEENSRDETTTQKMEIDDIVVAKKEINSIE